MGAPRRRRPGPAAALAVLAALAAGLAGCNIVAPVTYLLFGQPKVDAKYELADRPTVVFVDDRNNVIPMHTTRIRRAIGERVSTELMEQEVLARTIRPGDAIAVARARDREGDLLSVEAIGETVGAEQVIYVEMTAFRGSPDGFTPRPTAGCRVKVLDVVERRRLFPPESEDRQWHEVGAVSPQVSAELYRSSQGRREIEQMMAELLGSEVARLFYRHTPRELGSRLGGS